MVTRLDRLARSTRDLLNTLATINDGKGGFRSLGDIWADTTTPHVRLTLTLLGRCRRLGSSAPAPSSAPAKLTVATLRRIGLEAKQSKI